MTTFIGAEYIIGNLLIAKKTDTTSLAELNEASYYLQRVANEEGVDVIYLTSFA